MQGMDRQLRVGFILLSLGACTTALPPEKTEAIGGPFNEQVKEGYLQLAGPASMPLGSDYAHFRGKARHAMLGDVVYPDRVASYELPPGPARDEALALRYRLVEALEAGGRERAPVDAAIAQVNFDCWLSELGPMPPSREGEACKETMLAALSKMAAGLAGPTEPYSVYFESGSAELSLAARSVIDEAARAAGLARPQQIEVVGYTDLSGSVEANQILAARRAQAVADALVEAGASPGAVETSGEGEASVTDLAQESRRVDIVFTR
jgi:outer membrane protein OmpA-like peptidoglycan-associated protein